MISGVNKSYCQGYLDCKAYESPRLAYRIVRSDGKVISELSAREDVSVGMVAGWPTPEQYEFAAEKALKRAKEIREFQEKQDAEIKL